MSCFCYHSLPLPHRAVGVIVAFPGHTHLIFYCLYEHYKGVQRDLVPHFILKDSIYPFSSWSERSWKPWWSLSSLRSHLTWSTIISWWTLIIYEIKRCLKHAIVYDRYIYIFKQTVIYNEVKKLTVLKVCRLEINFIHSSYIFYVSRDCLSVSVFNWLLNKIKQYILILKMTNHDIYRFQGNFVFINIISIEFRKI